MSPAPPRPEARPRCSTVTCWIVLQLFLIYLITKIFLPSDGDARATPEKLSERVTRKPRVPAVAVNARRDRHDRHDPRPDALKSKPLPLGALPPDNAHDEVRAGGPPPRRSTDPPKAAPHAPGGADAPGSPASSIRCVSAEMMLDRSRRVVQGERPPVIEPRRSGWGRRLVITTWFKVWLARVFCCKCGLLSHEHAHSRMRRYPYAYAEAYVGLSTLCIVCRLCA